tara:strand:+ start:318 stop:692 length:375 start_codon:yes stop_codon:yes gene_type:complete
LTVLTEGISSAFIVWRGTIGVYRTIADFVRSARSLLADTRVGTPIIGVAEKAVNRCVRHRSIQASIIRARVIIIDRNRLPLADNEPKLGLQARVIERAGIAIDATYLTRKSRRYALTTFRGTRP